MLKKTFLSLLTVSLLFGCAGRKALVALGERVGTIQTNNGLVSATIYAEKDKDKSDILLPVRIVWNVSSNLTWEITPPEGKGFMVVVIFYQNGKPVDYGYFDSAKCPVKKDNQYALLEVVQMEFK